MNNRMLRFGVFAVPAVMLAIGVVTACSDDPNVDDSPSVPPTMDATTGVDGTVGDSTMPVLDAKTDAGADATTADADAEAGLPALCETYPNTVIMGDAATEPQTFARFKLIAYRAIYTGPNNTFNNATCEISEAFQNDFDPPLPGDCLGVQLAALAGCKDINGTPIGYATAIDQNADNCVAAGGPSIQLGFRVPNPDNVPPPYTVTDVNKFIDIIRLAAIQTGMSVADANRLKALLDAERNKVVTTDAGFDASAGYSNSICP